MQTCAYLNLSNPHALLGLHLQGEKKVIRLFRPGATRLHLELFGSIRAMVRLNGDGLFELQVPSQTTFLDYRVYLSEGRLEHDPYAFLPTWGEMDAHFFNQGTHYQLYQVMGGRLTTHQGVKGAKFAVWAPQAKSVALVGDFNQWDGRVYPLRSMGASGVWELFVPGLKQGEKYKFEIRTQEGALCLKADPYAYYSEKRPQTASVLFDVDAFAWTDHKWISNRGNVKKPVAIYEVHAGSWKKGLGYRELAHALATYCKEMGFTHVEFLPLAEHPLDESWGYQVTGFYAVTSRFGTPEDFQYLVNYLHGEGIGVIVDWVPAHFPCDDFSLAQFDGSYLYEHADVRKGFHPHWNTLIFNYGRHEVANFLLASALFWFDKMHVDGLRVDAVASMLYLDYGRKEGEWIPNVWGGKENLEAIEFLKHLNAVVHRTYLGVLMCAEESTSFPGVSHPLEWQGLGFDLKWNMGWMNDTLRYFHRDPLFRHYHQDDLTFGLVYAFSERFILVLSHDEVVHGKRSLLAKMPGDDWQKFANVRLLYSYMICQPGKKLLFMGGELGQWKEWDCLGEIEWHLLAYERHQQLKACIAELNQFYQARRALWEKEFEPEGFQWIDFQDSKNAVISYLRKGEKEVLACVHNFTPAYLAHYFVKLAGIQQIREIFNTDQAKYGGSGKSNEKVEIVFHEGQPVGFIISLAPLATLIFEVHFGN